MIWFIFVPAKQTPSRLEKKEGKEFFSKDIVFLFFRQAEIVQKEGDNTFRLECDIE